MAGDPHLTDAQLEKLDVPDSGRKAWKLHQKGKSPAQIAKKLALTRTTIQSHLSRIRRQIPAQPELAQLQAVGIQDLIAGFGDLAKRSVEHLDDAKLEEASARDLSIIAGIATDKWQLLRGQPTARTEISDHRKLDEIVKLMLEEAKRRGIEVEMEPSGGVWVSAPAEIE